MFLPKVIEYNAAAKTATVYIYEDIGDSWLGGISAKDFAKALDALGKLNKINVRINSAGGSVFEGLTIYNLLRTNAARVEVDIDGLAASIASVIAMAGDEVRIADNAMMMIHKPWIVAAGTADDLREQATVLDKVEETLVDTYLTRTGPESRDKIMELVKAETWLTATEARDLGLADVVTEEIDMAACAYDKQLLSKYRNVPEQFLERAVDAQPRTVPVEIEKMRARHRLPEIATMRERAAAAKAKLAAVGNEL